MVAAVVLPSPTAAVVPSGALWASPAGSGTSCTKAAPCSIEQGFSNLGPGATLVLEPGHYGTETAPVTVALSAPAASVEGEPRHAAPTIVSDVPTAAADLSAGSVSNLKLLDLSSGDGVVVGGEGAMDHVTVFADTMKGAAACVSIGALVTNSLCVNTGLGAEGLGVLTVESLPVTAEAVTAVDTRSGGSGIVVGNVTSDSTAAISLTNDLAVGSTAGGAVAGLASTSTTAAKVTVQLSHCDAKNLVPHNSDDSSAVFDPNRTDITAAPKFRNAAADNFAERAGSPTINRGAHDVLDGETDVSGGPRVLGSAPDIGAYEFAQPPGGLRIKVLAITAHAIRLRLWVDPEGLPARATILSHPAVKRVHRTLAGDRRRSFTVRLTRLKPKTRYRLELKAKNQGGSSHTRIHVATK
jgi:hypothetical protein